MTAVRNVMFTVGGFWSSLSNSGQKAVGRKQNTNRIFLPTADCLRPAEFTAFCLLPTYHAELTILATFNACKASLSSTFSRHRCLLFVRSGTVTTSWSG